MRSMQAAHLAAKHPDRFVGLLLLAPALHYSEAPVTDVNSLLPPESVPTIVIHGVRDVIVPIDGSRRYAEHGARLIETDDDHRLSDSLDHMVLAVQELMETAS